MILQIKNEFDRITQSLDSTFECKSISELEDFVQGYDFADPLINLEPVTKYRQNIMPSGAIRYDFNFNLYFLSKFNKSDTLELNKDLLIDDIISLSEKWFRELNKNEALFFINPKWTWATNVVRQYTSNLLLGVMAEINIDTACNRVPINNSFSYLFDATMN